MPARLTFGARLLARTLVGTAGALVLAAASATAIASGEDDGNNPLYLKIHPNLIVNLDGGDRPSFLMLSATVRALDVDSMAAAKHHMPAIRHHLLMLLSGKKTADLTNVKGKEATRKEALATVRDLLSAELGKPGVKDLYFTELIVE